MRSFLQTLPLCGLVLLAGAILTPLAYLLNKRLRHGQDPHLDALVSAGAPPGHAPVDDFIDLVELLMDKDD